MTRQAQVGAFALIALLLLFGVFYVITDFGTRHTGYRVGVHFESAAGLTSGALVYFSGVGVGSVDSIQLLSDNTVDVILAVDRDIEIPTNSKFLIQAPLTGSPNVLIVPPVGNRAEEAMLPKQVLPVEQQPKGTNTATIADLLQQGQGEIKRFDDVLAQIEARTPKLLNTLQTTLDNANDLTVSTKAQIQQLTGELLAMSGNLQTSLQDASRNVVALSATLNTAATTDSAKVGTLLDQFQSTSASLNRTMSSLEGLATNPQLKSNVLSTTQSIAEATHNLASISHDLQKVTGDPQTQAQLRNTIANLDATMQKANSLLGELGGTSQVYGVDQGAPPASSTPSPLPWATYVPSAGAGAPPAYVPSAGGSAPPGSPSAGPTPATSNALTADRRAKLQSSLNNVLSNLVNIQLRISGLSVQHNPGLNPVLPANQGPLGDLNLDFFPHGPTSVMVGASAIGNNTTWNAALLKGSDTGFRFGGGVLYSQIGALAQYNSINGFGLETRVYDLRYPMIDLYGNLKVFRGTQLFFGERDINHASRRTTAGFQYTF